MTTARNNPAVLVNPVRSVTSAGRDRWFWATWRSALDIYRDTRTHSSVAHGYADSEEDAHRNAIDAGGRFTVEPRHASALHRTPVNDDSDEHPVDDEADRKPEEPAFVCVTDGKPQKAVSAMAELGMKFLCDIQGADGETLKAGPPGAGTWGLYGNQWRRLPDEVVELTEDEA